MQKIDIEKYSMPESKNTAMNFLASYVNIERGMIQMSDETFKRYNEAKRLISEMPEGTDIAHMVNISEQLLHLEQGRGAAKRAWDKYCREMNGWEDNLLNTIKRMSQNGGKFL